MAKQRQMKIEQRGGLAAMQALEQRSDEELERETRNRAAAMAILGSRAAERYDAPAARRFFQQALAAARPQERPQIRRMAEAALALAERRSNDLAAAAQRLGQEAPSRRQLFLLRLAGLLVPPPGSGGWRRARGVLLIILLLVLLGAVATGLVWLVSLPIPGSLDTASLIVLGIMVLVAALVGLVVFGRRRQRRAQAKRAEAAQQMRQPTNRASRRRG
ncbi:hypothetical protein SK069_00735 [Patulibacter brassicae]|jgi:uncharacterized protein YhhL (DUF1145 family)|uniref:Tetratricopeptide repeat protein n=1 Tax=Patulibacter brassicae TaxID=1705717 RepID=A0ABU4VEG6_9ACTN|nr:hypothetical protein [Patulibacter brassicae]MDX8150104.1 hypothetical protein [Patulibacter brassicae]